MWGNYLSALHQVHSIFQSQFSKACNLVLPLPIYGSCLHILRPLSYTTILPSIFPSTACFIWRFLRKVWPILLAFLQFILCRIFLLLLLFVTFLFSHDRVNLFCPSFSETTLQNFPSVSDLILEMAKILHHANTRSTHNIFIFSLIFMTGGEIFSSSCCWIMLFQWHSWI